MTFKRFLPVITALILALTLVLASFSVMAAGNPAKNDDDPITDTSETNPVDDNGVTVPQTDPTQPTVSSVYISGDIDGDGDVDIDDVTTLQSVFLGLVPKGEVVTRNGDTNVDGKINIWDATVIQLKIAGIFKKLPVTTDGYYAEIIQP